MVLCTNYYHDLGTKEDHKILRGDGNEKNIQVKENKRIYLKNLCYNV